MHPATHAARGDLSHHIRRICASQRLCFFSGSRSVLESSEAAARPRAYGRLLTARIAPSLTVRLDHLLFEQKLVFDADG
jgi:hypothetical protein